MILNSGRPTVPLLIITRALTGPQALGAGCRGLWSETGTDLSAAPGTAAYCAGWRAGEGFLQVSGMAKGVCWKDGIKSGGGSLKGGQHAKNPEDELAGPGGSRAQARGSRAGVWLGERRSFSPPLGDRSAALEPPRREGPRSAAWGCNAAISAGPRGLTPPGSSVFFPG